MPSSQQHCPFGRALILWIIYWSTISEAMPENERTGLVWFSQKRITAYNNRNLTVICNVDFDLYNGSVPSFTTDARMVLSFMTVPRDPNRKPIHQMQSFLHCLDPKRTRCLGEFNFDISCLEDQIDRRYISRKNYLVEMACQIDDSIVCSREWILKYPTDCHDLGEVFVINAPKLDEKCLYPVENITLECGHYQECNLNYGICQCKPNYFPSKKQCILWAKNNDSTRSETSSEKSLIKASTWLGDMELEPDQNYDDDGNKLDEASKATFRAIVIYLLIIAIILCIALGIVIIWSRHSRRLLKDIRSNGA